MIPFEDMSREELLSTVKNNHTVVGQWMDAVERVRILHSAVFIPELDDHFCEWDDETYPCTTIQVLDNIDIEGDKL